MNENNLIDCTGNVCKGDYVEFERAYFSGSWRKPKFEGLETIQGLIVSDSYGKAKQQHTFTILQDNGIKIRIKGRNLYRNGCKRQLWKDETQREKVLAEKYERGDQARAAKLYRQAEQHTDYYLTN